MVLLFFFALAQIALMGAVITWDLLHPRLSTDNEVMDTQTQKAGAKFAAALPRTDCASGRLAHSTEVCWQGAG